LPSGLNATDQIWRRNPNREFPQRIARRRENQAWPRSRLRRGLEPGPAELGQHPGSQQRGFPGAGHPRYDEQPGALQPLRYELERLGGCVFTAEEQPRILFLERVQATVGRCDRPLAANQRRRRDSIAVRPVVEDIYLGRIVADHRGYGAAKINPIRITVIGGQLRP